jgi:hypothetical protein
MLATGGDGSANLAACSHAAAEPNQVGMADDAIGDLDIEMIAAIANAALG